MIDAGSAEGGIVDHKLLYDWFGDSVPRHADEIALEVGGHVLTYTELDILVGAIGARLLESADRPLRRVGLLASRSRTAYAGYLAVLRLGATPVPLNIGYPRARNAAIAAAAGLDLVISDSSTAISDAGVLTRSLDDTELDTLEPVPAAQLPQSTAALDDFAYILFTSGSTGTPKGVPLTHRNLSPFINHVRARYPAGPGARLSQAAELTFDVAVHDMFVAWSTGAALVVPTRPEILAPVDFINRNELTHWYSVPSVISLADRAGDLTAGAMPSLRYSMFAGEPLMLSQIDVWRSAAPNSDIDNIYGPTELTSTCCEYRLPADQAEWPRTGNGSVPIGYPYPGMEQAILGEDGLPAEVGELVMRGVQRFPGYLDSAQNSGRFLTFDGTPARVYNDEEPLRGDHWYRTGDLVDASGEAMVHLGRLDHQVKVRGHRVEVGEIEESLRQVYGVREAVVVAKPGGDGAAGLRAVFTGLTLDPAVLLDGLREQVPDYMVPSVLIHLDELPLNFNGKIDRSLLAGALFDK